MRDSFLLLVIQFSLTVSLIIIAVLLRRKYTKIPFILRPDTIMILSVIIGSSVIYGLTYAQYVDYLILWSFQALGVILGLIVSKTDFISSRKNTTYVLDRIILTRISYLTLFASVVAVAIFFSKQGIPVLLTGIEQGRVDAATGGSGYFRLFGYMSIPASTVLFSINNRYKWISIIIAIIITIGMANRSPLLYLAVPLLFIILFQSKTSVEPLKVLVAVMILGTIIVGFGTYRIVSQEAFQNYDEYREDFASKKYISIAATSLLHYAAVVPKNAILAKDLIDSGHLQYQFGLSYFTILISALPGEQLSLDRLIKKASGKYFIGGGTPPTLMGEGYINFGYVGTVLNAFLAIMLLRYWSVRVCSKWKQDNISEINPLTICIYGFTVCWVFLSQVAGFAGASTFPIAAFFYYLIIWKLATKPIKD